MRMRKGISICLIVFMCLFMVGQVNLLAESQREVVKSKPTHQIFMKGHEFKSVKEVKIPAGLEKKGYLDHEKGQYIIRFVGPILDKWTAQMERAGVTMHDYIPDYAFLVEMTNETREFVESQSYVAEVVVYQPVFKLDPDLVDEYGVKKFKDDKDAGDFFVQTFTDDLSDIEMVVKNANGKIKGKGKGKGVSKLHIKRAYLDQLAQLNNVKYIEEVAEYHVNNDVAKGYTDVDDMWNLGYDGTGQIVGVADTGLDTGVNDATMNADFQGRILAIYGSIARPDDPADYHGHGTHVAGSVLGSGANSNGQFKGMAPGANLVVQSIAKDSSGVLEPPANLNDLYGQAYADGVRVHSNSWSAGVNKYMIDSKNIDQFVNDHRDMIILFSASNEGRDRTTGEYPIYDTMGTTANAKNCITVGASETYRPDKISDPDRGYLADNPNEIAAFSSRGYAEDGRLKPDVVAPGTWICSVISSKNDDLSKYNGVYDQYYAYWSGTSMSTPVTAGAVAVARQYIMENWNHTPNASLMKALMINGSTDLGYGFPSRDQGWGRISLTNALTDRDIQFVDETHDMVTGDRMVHNYTVESSNTTLKISLVWTDYPSATTVSKNLVNDLDLKVTAPDGTVYYGNDFTSPFDSDIDRLNNVENVFVDLPATGNWIVEVLGYNVPKGPQNYSLVVGGDLISTPINDSSAPTVSITAPINGVTVSNTVTISANASDDKGVNRVEFYVDGTYIGRDLDSPFSFNWDSVSVANGSHSISAKAFDAAGNNTTSNSVNITTDNTLIPSSKTQVFIGYMDVNINRSHYYDIQVTGVGPIEIILDEPDGTSDMSMKLYDPSGTMVMESELYGLPKDIVYSALTTGVYQIELYAYRSSGYTLTATYPINGGVVDNEAPTCSIISPTSGETVSGNATITAIASDNVAIERVDFYVDDNLIGTDTSDPYSIILDTVVIGDGSHNLQVKVSDLAGNVSISNIVTANVDNGEMFTGYVSTSEPRFVEYFIDVTESGTIDLNLSWDTSADLDLYLYNPSGSRIADSFGSKPEVISYSATTTGQYSIKVQAYTGSAYFTLRASYPGQNSVPDTIAPTCNLTAPVDGATVNNTITIDATANDDVAVSRVEFYVDSNLIGTDTTSPYSVNWNSTTVVNGSYTLQAKAYDVKGNEGTSTTISVTVDNLVDTTAPSCSLTDPADGATVNDTITISATASDDVAVDQVEFYVDGNLVGTDTTSPYSINWNSTTVVNGNYTVQAKAYDAAGNEGTSSTISVTVDNFIDTTAPSCSLTAPTDGATVSDTTTISATASDDVAVDKVEFYVDGNLIGTDTTSHYSIDWDTTTVSNGSYTLQVKAYDAAGNVGTSTSITVTVDNPFVTKQFTGFVDKSGTSDAYFYIDVIAAGDIDLSLTWDSSADLDMYLYDPSGTEVKKAYSTSKPETISYSATTTGQYQIKVDAYSSSGNFTLTATYPGTDIVDTIAPNCSLTAPTDSATVSATTTISATASDDQGVSRVEFYVDSALVGTDTTSPYSFDWNTTTVSNGSHTLEVKAYDFAGNSATSTTITVNVDNGTGTGPEVYTGTVSTTGSDGHEFYINVTSSGTIDLHLDWIGSGDLDLYLHTPGGSWADTSFYSKPETISYNATTTGQYKIVVDAYSGSGDYTLTVTYPGM